MSKEFTPVTSITERDLPPVLRIFWKQTGIIGFQVANLICALTCFCTMSPRIRFLYFFDGLRKWHHLLIHAMVLGQSGDGKSFSRDLFELLMAPILDRDLREEEKEKEYAEKKKTMGDKFKEKEPLTVKICLFKATKNKLVKRADKMVKKYGEPLTFLMYTDELSQLLEKRGTYGDLRDLDKLAYDWGSKTSVDTNSDNSYCATADINWCSIWNTTPAILERYMDKSAIESGNVNRTIYMYLGDLLASNAPMFRDYSDKDMELIKKTQDKLMMETYGENDTLQPMIDIDMTWLFAAEKKWCEYQMLLVSKSGSYARNSFYKRCSVSAARLATMVYHLWGEDPTKRNKVKKLYYFFADYILKWQLVFFGKKYEQSIVLVNDNEDGYGSGNTLYDKMPKRFTRDQLEAKRKEMELVTESRKTLYVWLKKRLITKVEDSETELFEKNF
ncbi:MAG: hypothetical protein ACI4T5_00465 [Prevotella sp.]